ncbi:MAG: S8 family serine peptidase [Halanaerobiales bacterium]
MNRRESWILFIILILIFVGYIYPFTYNIQEQESVTIFVIDSFDEGMLSHGDIVSSIIEQEVPQYNIKKLNVKKEDNYGVENYYQALTEVYNYKLENNEEKVIVNISLGFYEAENYHEILIENLSETGVGIIAAAGNDDSSISFYPAAFEEDVVAVASIQGDTKTNYSNYGEYIDICAEGSFFTTISLPQFFSYRTSGTSFAAPRVSSFIAKIMAAEELGFEEALTKLRELSVPLDDELYEKGLLGKGKISNWKYLLNYNRTKLVYYYLLPLLIFSLIFYLLIKKMGFIAVPYFFLILVVLGPTFMILRDHLRSLLHSNIITLYNFKLFIVFILSYLTVKFFTKFEKYYLLKLYFIINLIFSLVLSYGDILTWQLFIYFNIVLIISFYIYEHLIYRKKKDSDKIEDLNSSSFRVINAVKQNITDKDQFNEMNLYNLLKLYKKTTKRAVKKAIVDVLIIKLKKIPLAFLIGNSNSYIIHQYIFDRLDTDKNKVEIEELFLIIKFHGEYMDEIFSNYSFNEIREQLKREFKDKEISLNKLLKIIYYYGDDSIIGFLLKIYENYSKCWDRFLIARTVLELADEKERENLIERFKNDKCGIVQEEAEHFI